MPRKIGYKWERVVDLDNCRAAVREMLKSKKRRSLYAGLNTASRKRLTCIIRKRAQRREWNGTVRYFRDHVEEIALQIHEELRSGTWKPKPYREKLIYDALRRKWRRLKVPCLYDQAVHHAIMRQTIPDIMARKYYYDCGSVPEAGQSRAVDALARELRKQKPYKYALSMDVYHFFESCKAQAVMRCLRRIYKDRAFLALHETILRSMGDGLAIGFYPSPWYGNLVLCFAIDRVVEHQARKAFHVRYVDDVAILANSKRLLRRLRAALAESLAAYGLEMKANWAIYPTAKQPIAFLTYRFYRGYTLVRKGIMYRLTRCARACGKNLTPSRAMAMISYKGILQRCNSYRLRKDHVYPYTNFKKCRKVVKYVASICGIYRTAPELCGA